MTRSAIHLTRSSFIGRHQGFSILELSVVLIIAGILAYGGSVVLDTFAKYQAQSKRTISVELARQSLLTFLARENRLPCPDMSGNGWPGDADGTCNKQTDLGYLPYRILDFTQASYDEDVAQRIVYGVFRDGETADLIEPYAPLETIAGDSRHAALIHTLHQVAQRDVSKNRPYVTGPETNPDAPGLTENCDIAVDNPAFVLIIPGTLDQTGSRIRGGINASLINASKCVAAPERKPDPGYNDSVHAESRLELLGWYVHLTQSSSQ